VQPTERRTLFGLILVVGLAWIGLSADPAGHAAVANATAPQVGLRAPDFVLSSLDGNRIRLSELGGKAVVLNLWATWCPPCRAEMPALEKAYREFAADGLVVLAVNATTQDDIAAVQPFAEELGLTMPILLDAQGLVSKTYQLRSLPSTFFIDRTGAIREVVIGGPMSEALLRIRIGAILG